MKKIFLRNFWSQLCNESLHTITKLFQTQQHIFYKLECMLYQSISSVRTYVQNICSDVLMSAYDRIRGPYATLLSLMSDSRKRVEEEPSVISKVYEPVREGRALYDYL